MEGGGGGLGRKRFSYPPFRRQSRRLQTGSENKSCCTWGNEPREQANLNPPSPKGRPNPAFPSSYTPTHPPPVKTGNRKVLRRKEREPDHFEPRNSPLPLNAEMGLGGRRDRTGTAREVEKGWGSLTAVQPGRRLQPRTMGRGRKGGGLRGEWGCCPARPARAHPRGGQDRDCPPPRPRERARLAQPCSSELEAGRMGGVGSRVVPRWPEF